MGKGMKILVVVLVSLLVFWQTGLLQDFIAGTFFRPDYEDPENGQDVVPDVDEDMFSAAQLTYSTEVVATDLAVPWDLAFLPDGRMLVTERSGRVLILPEKAQAVVIDSVTDVGEGGLLGIALDPDFDENSYVYLYYTYGSGTTLFNRISRFHFSGDALMDETYIVDGLPGAVIHNGGRIRFGPDGMLYVSTGDASSGERAQDPEDLAGKILRYRPDGSIPADNPDPESPVYSLGHRNPQGLAWHPLTGDLYASEHGPRRQDEINRIAAGENYGWPERTCETGHGEYQSPVTCYIDFTLAPSGMDFLQLKGMAEIPLYVAGLRGNMVRRLDFSKEGELLREEALFRDWGRLRLVTEHEGALYVLTNNRDGRGTPGEDDDRLIRIVPQIPESEESDVDVN